MTFRLVTLMSVVLLLSLAAFGLLMAHYQDQVMAEVANTASAVGQATLLELRDGLVADRREGDMLFWRDFNSVRTGGFPEAGHEAVNCQIEKKEADGRTTAVMVLTDDPAEQPEKVVRYHRFSHQMLATGDDTEEVAVVGHRVDGRLDCADGEGDCQVLGAFEYLINVEEVRAESDPNAGGLVLRIPRFMPTPGDAHPAQDVRVRVEADPAAAGQDWVFAQADDVKLPIPMREYDELFASFRGRSLFLFLGVFVVGTVLSTGLATHFTRPMRKLDGAIRRLSDGDLDVSVPVQGRDEIGRLSRAFNEMASKLRVNRDRSREMVRREKLSALGRMAAGVAHDVRNPLHSIGLTLQHLRETSRPARPDAAREFDRGVEVIRGEVRRLDRLIENFLRFAKSERQERLPVNLAELLRETARLVQKEAERRSIRLNLDLAGDTPSVLADGEALRSSILNLVLNSFEAMPGGGELSIRLGSNGREVTLEVADTGEGIPAEDRERVFEFAYTTRDGGNGLGLAMVHHCVVEEHGGRVSLDSRPGEGTHVRLALPLGEAAAS